MPPFGEWVIPAAKVTLLLIERFKRAVNETLRIANKEPLVSMAIDTMARWAMQFSIHGGWDGTTTVHDIVCACHPFLFRENLGIIATLNNDLTIHNFNTYMKQPEYTKFFMSSAIEVAGTASKHLNGMNPTLNEAKHAYDALVAV